MTQQFNDTKYTMWYYSLIKKVSGRSRLTGLERHHVVPESFFKNRTRKGPPGWLDGNPDDPSNVVYLTPREHLLAHKLLKRMTSGVAKKKMSNALWVMMNTKSSDGTVRIIKNGREYQELRRQHIEESKKRNASDEFKSIMAEARSKSGSKEKIAGDKNCMKRPEIRKNWEQAINRTREKHLSIVQSDSHRQNLSVIMTEKMNDPEINARLRASLAKPSTKALKSANMTGSKNPMYDGTVYVCVNEKQEKVEIGTLKELAKRLEISDSRSLKRSLIGKETRWGWKLLP